MSAMDIVSHFGSSVRNLRHRMGLSQEALAERADLHRTYVAGIEGGARNVTLKVVDKLARALEVSVATLFSSAAELATIEENTGADASLRELVDILLAEDNADDAELTLRAFKQARFANQVRVVRDGEEALDYIFCRGDYSRRDVQDHPKLLLLDLDLPKISGLEVLRRLKADRRTQMIPVVVLTISRNGRDIAECRRLGAASYIVKPVDFHRLTAVTPELCMNWGLFKSPVPLDA